MYRGYRYIAPRMRAGIGVTYDRFSWFTPAYRAAEVVAMMIAPWFA